MSWSAVASRLVAAYPLFIPGPGTAKPANKVADFAVSIFGLAGGGVCPAGPVARTAVRSYRTISPLPPRVFLSEDRSGGQLCIFCGAIPPRTYFEKPILSYKHAPFWKMHLQGYNVGLSK